MSDAVDPAAAVITLADLAGPLDHGAFLARFGPVFEHSPWVAERAWARRPSAQLFAQLSAQPSAPPSASLVDVHRAMVAIVRASARAEQLALLRAHPELWGREARARAMTADSLTEQGQAGLLSLSVDQAARIDALNAAHQQKFGFPFIIAAMNNSREQILSEFERRLALDPEAEFQACLEQVFVITGLRIGRLRTASSERPGHGPDRRAGHSQPDGGAA